MAFTWSTFITPEETIKQEFSISLKYQTMNLFGGIAGGIIVGFADFYIGLVILLLGVFYWWYLKTSKHYAFTNKRILLVDSFIGTRVVSIDYNQITDIEVTQSAADEIFGWGTIAINTAGTYSPVVKLSFIDDPQGKKQLLDKTRDANT